MLVKLHMSRVGLEGSAMPASLSGGVLYSYDRNFRGRLLSLWRRWAL